MANYSIKTDLLKVQGAFVTNITGKTETKRCLCIPLDGSGLYVGAKGVYLNLTAVELREPKYEDTHLVKVSVGGDVYRAMSDEERRAIPIIGGMHTLAQQTRTETLREATPPSAGSEEGIDDLPF